MRWQQLAARVVQFQLIHHRAHRMARRQMQDVKLRVHLKRRESGNARYVSDSGVVIALLFAGV